MDPNELMKAAQNRKVAGPLAPLTGIVKRMLDPAATNLCRCGSITCVFIRTAAVEIAGEGGKDGTGCDLAVIARACR